ncbi:hypothetical protein GTA08_BOTSDO02507 [Neofusicoccum parvum]|uniref:Uncharacterized protein n=1 Tax=Neofusicoccum parvum TaxID=310453 RepID=A0ACB5SPF9_9PEZI|nr:hypothetical protein GTA08_BOTSDO02507 [Neofusicoccum parvum]GME51430.1 hypothetical protein GTA08_BOTSDO02507 [Neofusicoccum parvum]
MEAEFTTSTVILDHSNHIGDVECISDGLNVTFTTIAAFQHARNNWASNTTFVAITANVTCGSAPAGQHTFWQVTGANFANSSLSAQLEASETSIDKVVGDANIKWGTAVPTIARRSDSHEVTFDLHPNATVNSKYWGLAYEIIQEVFNDPVDISCVNCTVSGSANIDGEFGLSFNGGFLKSGMVTLSGGLSSSFYLGLVGDLDVSYTYTDTIMSVGLPGFSIWNVITVGPVIAQKFSLSLDADLDGQLLVGTTGEIPTFSATLDFYDPTNSSVTGWDPGFTDTNFTANGTITGEVVFGLPLSIGIGIDVPLLDFSKLLAVVNEPYVNNTVQYANGVANDTCNNGLDYQVALGDEVSLNVLDITTLSLWKDQAPPIVQGCYLLPSDNSTMR